MRSGVFIRACIAACRISMSCRIILIVCQIPTGFALHAFSCQLGGLFRHRASSVSAIFSPRLTASRQKFACIMSDKLVQGSRYFLSYLGHLSLIAAVDEWIVFDNTQYTPKTWMNCNRIPHPTAMGWFPLYNSSISIKIHKARVLSLSEAKRVLSVNRVTTINSPPRT